MKIMMFTLFLAFSFASWAQIHPLPTRMVVTPVVKKKFKNLNFSGLMYASPGKLRNPVEFMLDPNVPSEINIKNFSRDTQKSFKAFLAEVAEKKDDFKVRHFKSLLKDMGSDTASADIEAIVFIVMMEAAKSSQEDLKTIMEQMKSTLKQKNEVRKAQERLKSARMNCRRDNCLYLSLRDLETLEAKLQNQADTLSEMGELESLRLQMAMDRMSKMMSMLSNVMKKVSDTATSITSNMK